MITLFLFLPKMCNDVFGILYSNTYHVSGDTYPIVTRDDEHFLREVITPLYEVLMMVSMLHK
jgi:callose synthase